MRGKVVSRLVLIVLLALMQCQYLSVRAKSASEWDRAVMPPGMSENKKYEMPSDNDCDDPYDEDEEDEEDDEDRDGKEDKDDSETPKKGEKGDGVDDNEDEEDDDEWDDEDEEDEEDLPLIKMTDYSGIISSNAVLVCGNKYVVSSNFIPEKYMVSDKKVLKINRYGDVKPKREGTAMIVAVGDEGESVSYFVRVEKPKMRSKSVLNGSVTDIMDMVDNYYEAYPSEIIIDKPDVARVDTETGDLYALRRGRTKITLMFGARKLRKVLKVK